MEGHDEGIVRRRGRFRKRFQRRAVDIFSGMCSCWRDQQLGRSFVAALWAVRLLDDSLNPAPSKAVVPFEVETIGE